MVSSTASLAAQFDFVDIDSVAEAELEAGGNGVRLGATTLSPIVVDMDGTLVATDTLVESVLRLVKMSPARIASFPLWLYSGRARFKAEVAEHGVISVHSLPYNRELLEFLAQERARGRRIVLATAAHETIAWRVAEHLALFDDVIATAGDENLKGERKLAAIQAAIDGPFVYVGDHAADIPIWRRAELAMVVGPRPCARFRREVTFAREFSRESFPLHDWWRELRIHQWVKNFLLFVPLLTSFGFLEAGHVARTTAAFFIFSIAASATYILDDLLDLEHDRLHPRKCRRPFASGRIPLLQGVIVAPSLLIVAFAAASMLSVSFVAMLLGYLCITIGYSLVLKQYILIDVLTLGLLYTLRIIAGSAAVGVSVTPWLLAFSVFLFISLALIKRCAELMSLGRSGRTGASGRDYQMTDLAVLWPLGVGTALSAVVVFGLFINAPETQDRYATPAMLWGVAFGLVYWLGRLWIKTARGEMHDDPIVFAARDRGSRVVIAGMVLVTVAARWVVLPGIS